MINLSIEKFLSLGTFFHDLKKGLINEFVINNSDSSFGEDIVMYYFNYDGYDITFVYDEAKEIVTAEQIEIINIDLIENDFLRKCLFLKNFVKEMRANIESAYYDDLDERVVFLKNGVNVHFNENILTKITSKSNSTRDLVMKIMEKIEDKELY